MIIYHSLSDNNSLGGLRPSNSSYTFLNLMKLVGYECPVREHVA